MLSEEDPNNLAENIGRSSMNIVRRIINVIIQQTILICHLLSIFNNSEYYPFIFWFKLFTNYLITYKKCFKIYFRILHYLLFLGKYIKLCEITTTNMEWMNCKSNIFARLKESYLFGYITFHVSIVRTLL